MFKLAAQKAPTVGRFLKARTIALPVSQLRFSSSGSKGKEPIDSKFVIPENFFDENLETERHFFDMARALTEKNYLNPSPNELLSNITVNSHKARKEKAGFDIKDVLLSDKDEVTDDFLQSKMESLDETDAARLREAVLKYKGLVNAGQGFDLDEMESADMDSLLHRRFKSDRHQIDIGDSDSDDAKSGSDSDVDDLSDDDDEVDIEGIDLGDEEDAEYMADPDEQHLRESGMDHFLPHGAENTNDLTRRSFDYPDELLHNFIPATHEKRYDAFNQGSRACPGKLQRRGRFPELKCIKIDLDELTYLDVLSLKEYLTEDGEIIPKKGTGLCSKCQRQVAKTIKAARNFGLMPHMGQFVVSDVKPQLSRNAPFHKTAAGSLTDSKTLL